MESYFKAVKRERDKVTWGQPYIVRRGEPDAIRPDVVIAAERRLIIVVVVAVIVADVADLEAGVQLEKTILIFDSDPTVSGLWQLPQLQKATLTS